MTSSIHAFSPTDSQNNNDSSSDDDDEQGLSNDLLIDIQPQISTNQSVKNQIQKNHAQKLLLGLSSTKNLDHFLQKIYYYYTHKGFHCIVIEKTLNLMYDIDGIAYFYDKTV